MKKLSLTLASLMMMAGAYAGTSGPGLSGDQGSINNDTGYVIECSQMYGGYCANDIMPTDGYIQMLLDPGSTKITGRIMVFDKSKPGNYIDNISFTYYYNGKKWRFTTHDLYYKIKVTYIQSDEILLTKAN